MVFDEIGESKLVEDGTPDKICQFGRLIQKSKQVKLK